MTAILELIETGSFTDKSGSEFLPSISERMKPVLRRGGVASPNKMEDLLLIPIRLKVPKKGQHGQGGSKSARAVLLGGVSGGGLEAAAGGHHHLLLCLPQKATLCSIALQGLDYSHLPKGLAKEIVVMEKELRNALPNVFYTYHCFSSVHGSECVLEEGWAVDPKVIHQPG